MNKIKTLVLCVGLLFLSTILFSQNEDISPYRQIKINATNIFNSQLFIGYESMYAKSFSITGEIGLLRKAYYLETIDSKNEPQSIRTQGQKFGQFLTHRSKANIGVQINVELRFYLNSKLNGILMGFRTGFQHVNFGKDFEITYHQSLFGEVRYRKTINPIQNRTFAGFIIGYNAKLNKRVSLEFNTIIGYQKLSLTKKEFVENPSQYGYGDFFYNNHFNDVMQPFIDLNIHLCFPF